MSSVELVLHAGPLEMEMVEGGRDGSGKQTTYTNSSFLKAISPEMPISLKAREDNNEF